MFGWKTGLICFAIWFVTSAITGYIINYKILLKETKVFKDKII